MPGPIKAGHSIYQEDQEKIYACKIKLPRFGGAVLIFMAGFGKKY
jgi:hypothetical protein